MPTRFTNTSCSKEKTSDWFSSRSFNPALFLLIASRNCHEIASGLDQQLFYEVHLLNEAIFSFRLQNFVTGIPRPFCTHFEIFSVVTSSQSFILFCIRVPSFSKASFSFSLIFRIVFLQLLHNSQLFEARFFLILRLQYFFNVPRSSDFVSLSTILH